MSHKSSTDQLVSIPVVPLGQPNDRLRCPTGLTFAAALTKLFLGPLSMVFAGMALLVDSELAKAGTGFWAGAIATTAGAFGVDIRNPRQLPIGFIGWTGLSLGGSALQIVLSGTGLAHDSMSAGDMWPGTLAANAILLVLATLDCLASIVGLAVELAAARRRHTSPGEVCDRKNHRLIQWLQTQRHLLDPVFNQSLHKPFKPLPHPQVYKLESQLPVVSSSKKQARK